MRARREHRGTRASRSWTQVAHVASTRRSQAIRAAARIAALCQTGGVRGLAGRGAGVRARSRPHGATARHVPPSARCHRRHRGRTQDGVRGVPAAASGASLELLRRRGRHPLRTRHAHGHEGGGVHVRDHVSRRDACAERGVRQRRPACVPVHHQPTSRHVDGGAVRVGRLRLGRLRRAHRTAVPGRARAGAGRAHAHEPAQQPRGPQGERDSEGPGAARVQVPRRVGLVCHAHVLARAALVPRRGGRAARAIRPRQARRGAVVETRARQGAQTDASRTCAESQGEPGRGASAAQVGAGVPDAVAVVLRARRRGRLARHAPADLQQDFQRRRRVRVDVLRARLQHGAQCARDQVPLSVQVVLPCLLRHLRRRHRDTHLQLTLHPMCQ